MITQQQIQQPKGIIPSNTGTSSGDTSLESGVAGSFEIRLKYNLILSSLLLIISSFPV